MKLIKIILFISLLCLFSSHVFPVTNSENTVIQLDKKFYSDLLKSPAVERDLMLRKIQNEIVQGRGYVESVEKIERYHRHLRISVIDNDAQNMNIRLFLFADNKEYLTLLSKGDEFEFKGQFIIFTPVSSKKDSYIFDIVLEEGVLSVQ